MNKNLMIVLGVIAIILIWLFYSRQPQTETMTSPTDSPEIIVEEDVMMEEAITLTLDEQNESGETGTATLVETDGQVTVTITMDGFPEDTPQPAHIHTGSCPDVGAVTYPLTSLVNGESVTILDVTLAQLESELPMGINVHQSAASADVYTACGDLLL